MRLIDADELKRSLSVSEILETRESLEQIIDAQPTVDPGVDEWCPDCKEYDSKRHMCPRFNRVIRETLHEVKAAQNGVGWTPCSEGLPDEDVDVLISYRYKEGEGDTSHVNIDITSYGDMYFGGNPVHDSVTGDRVKHWRQPFAYFTSNYEVVAWMPLPEPYKGGAR